MSTANTFKAGWALTTQSGLAVWKHFLKCFVILHMHTQPNASGSHRTTLWSRLVPPSPTEFSSEWSPRSVQQAFFLPHHLVSCDQAILLITTLERRPLCREGFGLRFDPWDLHGGRRKLTPDSYPLTYTHIHSLHFLKFHHKIRCSDVALALGRWRQEGWELKAQLV